MSEHGKNRIHRKFSEESKAKLSASQKLYHNLHPGKVSGKNNPMYGVTGERHPMFGKRGELSPVYAENNPMYGVTGEKHHCYGKVIINNGIREARLTKGEPLPEGWNLGRKKK